MLLKDSSEVKIQVVKDRAAFEEKIIFSHQDYREWRASSAGVAFFQQMMTEYPKK